MICLQNQILAFWISLQSSTGPDCTRTFDRQDQAASRISGWFAAKKTSSERFAEWVVGWSRWVCGWGVDDGFGLEVGRVSWGGRFDVGVVFAFVFVCLRFVLVLVFVLVVVLLVVVVVAIVLTVLLVQCGPVLARNCWQPAIMSVCRKVLSLMWWFWIPHQTNQSTKQNKPMNCLRPKFY